MKTNLAVGGKFKRFNPNRVVRNILNMPKEQVNQAPKSVPVRNLEGVKPYDVFEDVKQGIQKFNLSNGHKKKIITEELLENLSY